MHRPITVLASLVVWSFATDNCRFGDGVFSRGPCNQEFISCTAGVSKIVRCPTGLVYNTLASQCDFRHNVKACTQEDVKEHHNENVCAGSKKRFASGLCKNTFIECREHQPVNKQCPAGALFDATYGVCLYDLPLCKSQPKLHHSSAPVHRTISAESEPKTTKRPTYNLEIPFLPPDVLEQDELATVNSLHSYVPYGIPLQGHCEAGRSYAQAACSTGYKLCADGVNFEQRECLEGTRFDPVKLECSVPEEISSCADEAIYDVHFVNNAALGKRRKPFPENEGPVVYEYRPRVKVYDDGTYGDPEKTVDTFQGLHLVPDAYSNPFYAGRRLNSHKKYKNHKSRGPAVHTMDLFEGRESPALSNPFFDNGKSTGIVMDNLDKRSGFITDSIFKFYPVQKDRVRSRVVPIGKPVMADKEEFLDDMEGSGEPDDYEQSVRVKRYISVGSAHSVCPPGSELSSLSVGTCRPNFVLCSETLDSMMAVCPIGEVFHGKTKRCVSTAECPTTAEARPNTVTVQNIEEHNVISIQNKVQHKPTGISQQQTSTISAERPFSQKNTASMFAREEPTQDNIWQQRVSGLAEFSQDTRGNTVSENKVVMPVSSTSDVHSTASNVFGAKHITLDGFRINSGQTDNLFPADGKEAVIPGWETYVHEAFKGFPNSAANSHNNQHLKNLTSNAFSQRNQDSQQLLPSQKLTSYLSGKEEKFSSLHSENVHNSVVEHSSNFDTWEKTNQRYPNNYGDQSGVLYKDEGRNSIQSDVEKIGSIPFDDSEPSRNKIPDPYFPSTDDFIVPSSKDSLKNNGMISNSGSIFSDDLRHDNSVARVDEKNVNKKSEVHEGSPEHSKWQDGHGFKLKRSKNNQVNNEAFDFHKTAPYYPLADTAYIDQQVPNNGGYESSKELHHSGNSPSKMNSFTPVENSKGFVQMKKVEENRANSAQDRIVSSSNKQQSSYGNEDPAESLIDPSGAIDQNIAAQFNSSHQNLPQQSLRNRVSMNSLNNENLKSQNNQWPLRSQKNSKYELDTSGTGKEAQGNVETNRMENNPAPVESLPNVPIVSSDLSSQNSEKSSSVQESNVVPLSTTVVNPVVIHDGPSQLNYDGLKIENSSRSDSTATAPEGLSADSAKSYGTSAKTNQKLTSQRSAQSANNIGYSDSQRSVNSLDQTVSYPMTSIESNDVNHDSNNEMLTSSEDLRTLTKDFLNSDADLERKTSKSSLTVLSPGVNDGHLSTYPISANQQLPEDSKSSPESASRSATIIGPLNGGFTNREHLSNSNSKDVSPKISPSGTQIEVNNAQKSSLPVELSPDSAMPLKVEDVVQKDAKNSAAFVNYNVNKPSANTINVNNAQRIADSSASLNLQNRQDERTYTVEKENANFEDENAKIGVPIFVPTNKESHKIPSNERLHSQSSEFNNNLPNTRSQLAGESLHPALPEAFPDFVESSFNNQLPYPRLLKTKEDKLTQNNRERWTGPVSNGRHSDVTKSSINNGASYFAESSDNNAEKMVQNDAGVFVNLHRPAFSEENSNSEKSSVNNGPSYFAETGEISAQKLGLNDGQIWMDKQRPYSVIPSGRARSQYEQMHRDDRIPNTHNIGQNSMHENKPGSTFSSSHGMRPIAERTSHETSSVVRDSPVKHGDSYYYDVKLSEKFESNNAFAQLNSPLANTRKPYHPDFAAKDIPLLIKPKLAVSGMQLRNSSYRVSPFANPGMRSSVVQPYYPILDYAMLSEVETSVPKESNHLLNNQNKPYDISSANSISNSDSINRQKEIQHTNEGLLNGFPNHGMQRSENVHANYLNSATPSPSSIQIDQINSAAKHRGQQLEMEDSFSSEESKGHISTSFVAPSGRINDQIVHDIYQSDQAAQDGNPVPDLSLNNVAPYKPTLEGINDASNGPRIITSEISNKPYKPTLAATNQDSSSEITENFMKSDSINLIKNKENEARETKNVSNSGYLLPAMNEQYTTIKTFEVTSLPPSVLTGIRESESENDFEDSAQNDATKVINIATTSITYEKEEMASQVATSYSSQQERGDKLPLSNGQKSVSVLSPRDSRKRFDDRGFEYESSDGVKCTSPSPVQVPCVYSESLNAFPIASCSISYGLCMEDGFVQWVNCSHGDLFDHLLLKCVSSFDCGRSQMLELGALIDDENARTVNEVCNDHAATVRPLSPCSRWFVDCSHQRFVRRCSRDYVFSSVAQKCVSRQRVAECVQATTPLVLTTTSAPTTPTTTTQSTTTMRAVQLSPVEVIDGFCNKKANGIYRHPEKCEGVVKCYNGITMLMASCPSGLVFNNYTRACDYPAAVPECMPSLSRAEQTNAGCRGHEHGAHIADESKCTVFWRCVWNRLERMECPRGTFFNEHISVCDWPREVPECDDSGNRLPEDGSGEALDE